MTLITCLAYGLALGRRSQRSRMSNEFHACDTYYIYSLRIGKEKKDRRRRKEIKGNDKIRPL